MPDPEPKDAPIPGERNVTQQGVGQGTTIRRRRPPRKEVNDVAIAEAFLRFLIGQRAIAWAPSRR